MRLLLYLIVVFLCLAVASAFTNAYAGSDQGFDSPDVDLVRNSIS